MSQKSRSLLTQGRCGLIVVCILWLCGCSDDKYYKHPRCQRTKR